MAARKRVLWVLVSACLWSVAGVGHSQQTAPSLLQQAPYQQAATRNLRLVHVALEDGIADHRITEVVQDDNGFLWVGTEDGLYRYDGDRVLRFGYSRSDPTSLTHDHINALLVDNTGKLWIGTEGGLNQYLAQREGFKAITLPTNSADPASVLNVQSIYQDRAGILWIGTHKNGLLAYEAGAVKQYLADADNPNAVPSNHVSSLLEDARGNLWVGTSGGGLARFDKRREVFVSYQANTKNRQSLTSNYITRVYEDSQERLWIATEGGGINLFDRERQTFSSYRHEPTTPGSLSSDNVHDILLDNKGTIWVASDNGLSEMLDDGTFVHYQHDVSDPTSLSSDKVRRLHLDADGVLWLATHRGLDRWNYLSNAFNYVGTRTQQLRSNLVTAVAEGNDNSLWVGTKHAGLTHINRHTRTLTHYQRGVAADGSGLTDNRITALLMTPEGDLWVGTRDGGALRKAAGASVFQPLSELASSGVPALPHESGDPTPDTDADGHLDSADPSSAPPASVERHQADKALATLATSASHITTISGGAEGRVWLGTREHGLFLVQDNQLRHFAAVKPGANGLTSNHLISVYEDAAGVVWIGGDNGGLIRFDTTTEQFTTIPLESDRGSQVALDITASKDGSLWIGTAGGGLLHWSVSDRATGVAMFTHYAKSNGLRSNTVRSILEDQNGSLWLSSNRGLTRFDPNTLQTRHFDRQNGLRGDSFYAGAKLNSRSGRLYFGSNAGLVGFYPNAITQLRQAPRITLQAESRTELLGKAFNSADDDKLQLTLTHDANYISFRFAALHFVSPDQNRYLYKLQGFDEDWIDPQDTLIATYTSLPPGKYQFQVLAANPEGVWSSEPASIDLTVQALPWLSTTAKVLYGLLVATLIGFFLARLQLELLRVRSSRRTLEAQVELRTLELEERNRQLVDLNDKLKEASITDPLTGLLNRRSFYEFVSREVASVERGYTNSDGATNPNRRHLFFMMIDLDGFKPINDTFGHHTGDHTLVQVSELLTSCAREADTVFRWGGDEFLVIGQVQHTEDLEVLAERFRATIDDHRFDPKYGKALRLTASIGVAPYPFCENSPGVATWEQVADVADLAAYLAKTHGKNAWVRARGTDQLTAQALQQLKDNLDLLIETGMVDAVSSSTETPIPGANQR